MSELAFAAFRALGVAPTGRELALVARAIRESGDEEALALFGAGPEPEQDPAFDREACAAVAEVAERAGAGGLVTLDLYTEVINPGWSPFPATGVAAREAEELQADG
jgi:hypothetical protein